MLNAARTKESEKKERQASLNPHRRPSKLPLIPLMLHTLPLQKQRRHKRPQRQRQRHPIRVPQPTHIPRHHRLQLRRLPNLHKDAPDLRGARIEDDARRNVRRVEPDILHQAVFKHGLRDRDEHGAAEVLEEEDGRGADGDVVLGQDRLDGRHRDLEARADAGAGEDLVADPFPRGDVDGVEGQEAGADAE